MEPNPPRIIEGIDVNQYSFYGDGKEDLLHPGARYTKIERSWANRFTFPGETYPVILVEGARPRALNFGVKTFNVTVTPVSVEERKTPRQFAPDEEMERRLEVLVRYLSHRL